VRRVIAIICCAAIAALLSGPAPADGDTRARDPGPSSNDQKPEDTSGPRAAGPAATPQRAPAQWSRHGAAQPAARAPERQTRVYWRSDRGRVKSRAEFAPD
jgi:hypothetical protein